MTNNPQNHHRYLADDDEHEAYTSLGLDGLLAATEKLLAVNRGIADPDDRDSLPNDRIHTVDRLMAERVKLDHGRTLRKMMGRLGRARTLDSLGADAFGDYTVGFITGNPLVPALEEINPMHLLEQRRSITKMGPGGIGDPNAITEDMQAVSATQFGFVDPIAGPECFDAKTEVFTARGWVAWPLVKADDFFACWDGELSWHKSRKITNQHHKGVMYTARTKNIRMCVTPNHRVAYRHYITGGVTTIEPAIASRLSIQIPVGSAAMEVIRPGEVNATCREEEDVRPEHWTMEEYNGAVYCATVAGGYLHVRGSSDTAGYWSGNSERAGIDVRLASGSRIGSDGQIYQLLRNRKSGSKEWVSPTMLQNKTLKIPD